MSRPLMLIGAAGDEYADALGHALTQSPVVQMHGTWTAVNASVSSLAATELDPAGIAEVGGLELLVVVIGAHDTDTPGYAEQLRALAERLQRAFRARACVWVGPLEYSAATRERRLGVSQAQRRARLPPGWGWIDGLTLSQGLRYPLSPWGYTKVAERLLRQLGVERPIDTIASSFVRAITFGAAD